LVHDAAHLAEPPAGTGHASLAIVSRATASSGLESDLKLLIVHSRVFFAGDYLQGSDKYGLWEEFLGHG
jgi:hypothetical protein